MKFTCQEIINVPMLRFVALWEDVSLLHEWQVGFIRREQMDGTPWTVGSKAKYYYEQGKSEMELLETVTLVDRPGIFEGYYEHKHMNNSMKNTFIAIDDNTTKWEMEIEYDFKFALLKIMSKLNSNMFKRPPQEWMKRLKAYAERNSV